MRNLFRYIGFRHLTQKPSRSLLTTLGVGLGVALFIAIQIINSSTLASFQQSIEAMAGKATLTVSAGDAGFPEDRLEVIQQQPGVLHAVPMIESHAYIAGGKGSSETLMILGVDMLKEQSVRTYKTTDEQVIEDPLVFLNQPDSVIVTRSFAASHNLAMDSKFDIATAHGKKTMTVRGLLTPEGPAKAYGGSLAIMDIDGARMTFGKEGKLDRVDVVTADGADVDAVAAGLVQALGAGYKAEKPQTQSANMERLVQSYQKMLSFFSTLALLVGLFLVTNSVSISVAERRKEIGTLRALGGTRRGMLALFLSEATVMGLVGSAVGVFLGRWLASALMGMVSRSMSVQYMTPMKPSEIIFGSTEIVTGMVIGTLAAFMAALWPSVKATTIQPLEAMKRQESVNTDGTFKFGFGMYLGFALLVFFSVASLKQWGLHFKALEVFNQVSSMVGAALIGPALVGALLFIFRPTFARLGGTVTRLAKDNLLRSPKRTGSNVMSLMVGLILVIIISTLNISFKNTIMGWFDRVLKSDIIVSSHGKISTFQVTPIHESLALDLAKIEGVVPPVREGQYGFRMIHFQYEGRQLGLKAYDEPAADLNFAIFDVKDRPVSEAGRELYYSPDETVMVSENFSVHFKKKTGDTIEIDTPTGRKPFRVVAQVLDFASPEGVVYMKRDTYKKYWKDHLVSGFGLRVLPGHNVNDVRAAIDRQLGQAKNLMTISNADLRQQIIQDIDESFAYTRAIEGAALLVGLLGLLNTFLISVMERTRELGMLRAVGMSRGQMRSMIIQEALVQGGFGAVVAVALGGWIAYLWITTSLSHVLGWIVEFSFPWMGVVATIFVGIAVTLIAGLYPARRAANLEIREALEYE